MTDSKVEMVFGFFHSNKVYLRAIFLVITYYYDRHVPFNIEHTGFSSDTYVIYRNYVFSCFVKWYLQEKIYKFNEYLVQRECDIEYWKVINAQKTFVFRQPKFVLRNFKARDIQFV